PVQRAAAAGLVAGAVEEQQLRVGTSDDTDDPVARGLRAVRRDRQLLADEPVQQGRLADVRTADDRDVPAAEHRRTGGNQAARAGRASSRPAGGSARAGAGSLSGSSALPATCASATAAADGRTPRVARSGASGVSAFA